MPLMAMSDSVMRSRRYPVQPAAMAAFGDDPDGFMEDYEGYVKRWFGRLKKSAPPEYVKRIQAEIQRKRWQKAHDMIMFFFLHPDSPLIWRDPGKPVAQILSPGHGATSFVSGLLGSDEGSVKMACCPSCATGAPCCGHDHGIRGVTDMLQSPTTMLVAIGAIAASVNAPRGKKFKYVLIGGAFGYLLQAIYPDIKKVFE